MINGSLSGTSAAQYSDKRAEFAQRAQSFKALGDALKSGDMAGAQKAYDTLQANAPKNANGNANSPMGQDFSALGDALKSGDVSAAQKAFATLQQDGQALHKAHGHHHRGAQAAQASAVPSASQDQDAGATTGFGGATLEISA